MCLKVETVFKTRDAVRTAYKKPLVAKHDIYVWKIFVFNWDGILVSPHRMFDYTCGYEYKSSFSHQALHLAGTWRLLINRGLHAYVNRREAKVNLESCQTIVRCKIPAGAKYFLGRHNEIASNRLIIGTKLQEFTRE
jgi:hypothetical protein